MKSEVAQVAAVDRDRAIATLVLAFASDPFARWVFADPAVYLELFPKAADAFGGMALDYGGGWCLDDFSAVGLWLPPGVEPGGEATAALFEAAVDPTRLDDLYEVFGQMDESHPAYPHWYLAWFGVDCAAQGLGLGSVLMTACLKAVDESHLPAYLDSTNPRNVPFYERHGFAVTARSQARACPPMISMLRPAR
jgi:ribosomal protein S18 acetylase RimI-like enzyme